MQSCVKYGGMAVFMFASSCVFVRWLTNNTKPIKPEQYVGPMIGVRPKLTSIITTRSQDDIPKLTSVITTRSQDDIPEYFRNGFKSSEWRDLSLDDRFAVSRMSWGDMKRK